MWGHGLKSYGSGRSEMADSPGYNIEPLGSIKEGNFYYHLKKNCSTELIR
jgi:hypothetical protein